MDAEDSRGYKQSSTTVRQEYTAGQNDGKVVTSQTTQVVARSARYSSKKGQKTTSSVVKTVQSDKVVINGDQNEVSSYGYFIS